MGQMKKWCQSKGDGLGEALGTYMKLEEDDRRAQGQLATSQIKDYNQWTAARLAHILGTEGGQFTMNGIGKKAKAAGFCQASKCTVDDMKKYADSKGKGLGDALGAYIKAKKDEDVEPAELGDGVERTRTPPPSF